jgi:hypothetical protein
MRKQIVVALVLLTTALMARTAYIVHAQTATAAELRTQLGDRYDIVPLQQGIALVPKQADSKIRMVQVVNGAVSVDGETLTSAQLRDRLGADAAPIVQLTYLSAAEQRQLAAPAPRSAAQPEAAPAPIPAPAPAPETPARSVERKGDVVRIGGSGVDVAENEHVDGDVVSIGGPVKVDGEVSGDVVAIGREGLTLGPHAVVRGEVTAVGGPLKRDPQAQVFGKVNEVGIGPNGEAVLPPFNARNVFFGTFASRAGRLTTTIARVLMFILFALIVTAVAQRPIQQIAARIMAEPVRAGLVGLLAEILFVPVLVVTIVALIISIIGIPLLILVPFGIIVIGVVMLVGYTGAAYLAGGWALDRFGGARRSPYMTVAIGIALIAGLTLLGRLFALAIGGFGAPLYVVGYLIEYLAWTIGFGAAIQTWIHMRRGPAAPAVSGPMPEPGPA